MPRPPHINPGSRTLPPSAPLLRFVRNLALASLIAAASLPLSLAASFSVSPLQLPAAGHTGFTRRDAVAAGITFTNSVSRDRTILNRNLLNGSGVAAGDVDGDGRCDLYFCGLDAPNALYRNLGEWRFLDITAPSGTACPGQDSTGAVFADVDQDGDLDLLVTALNHGTRLFLNDGHGRFHDATPTSGLLDRPGGTSMALADIDGDGDLDLYVAHYRPDTVADMPATTFALQTTPHGPVVVQVNGQPAALPQWTNRFEVSPLGRILELGLPDALYRNDGRGHFSPVSFTDGSFLDENGQPLAQPPFDWGLSVQFHDLNGDGAPDLYVCNDFFTPDRIWINDGSGRFRALPTEAIRTTSAFSMGLDCADIDRDGHVDIFVVDMLSPDHRKRNVQLGERSTVRPPAWLTYDRYQASRNSLQWNRGDTTFAEISQFAGVEASDWSWQPVFLDVDLDGFEDILVANGMLRDFQNVDLAAQMEAARAGRSFTQKEILDWIGRFPALNSPNVAYRNRGNRTFESCAAAWGFDGTGISQGMALADLDDDGDLDVVLNNFQDAPTLLRNESIAPRVAVRLRGAPGNPAGIGARIVVRGAPVTQSQEMICGGRYLSADQPERVFAAPDPTRSLRIEVTWRSGRSNAFDVPPNTRVTASEPLEPAPSASTPPATPPPTLFVDFPGLPDTRHLDPPFDESNRQPLLYRRLDRLGPGVTWHDLNHDGWPDLIAGNGPGGTPLVLLNRAGTRFERLTNAPFTRPLSRDLTTVLAVQDMLLAGSSSYEDAATNAPLFRIYDLTRRVAGDGPTGFPFATGPLALADVDADGDLDLFVGGRAIPGRYPEPADAILFRNDQGRFVPWQRWEKLGCVSAALFTDLDADGVPELLLAPDWSPLRVFQRDRDHDRYVEVTDAWGLGQSRGWWNGIATGDLDGDGRLEIIASNWGLNSTARASAEHPRRLHYGDVDDNGTVDLLESRFDPTVGKEVPALTLNWARTAMPFLHQRVPSYAAYGEASLAEIYGDALARTRTLEVNTLASTVFAWHTNHFLATPLPDEAQFAPAFGVTIADLDGDGAEDVVLAQNCFALAPGESRCDAGRGLLLRGDGLGHFTPLPGHLSGLRLYGDQRGCAVGDFDRDGRPDLAFGQNGDALQVFRNANARPGLRIGLRGPAGNPDGIGAQLWLEAGTHRGPAREVQAGTGYWSQNSSVQTLSLREGLRPERLLVRWPGGRVVTTLLPPNFREISVDTNGVATPLP